MSARIILKGAFVLMATVFLSGCKDEDPVVPSFLSLDELYLDITLERVIRNSDYVYLVVQTSEGGEFAPVELNNIEIYYNGEYQDSPFIYACDCPSTSSYAYRFNYDFTKPVRIDLVQMNDTLTQEFPVQNWNGLDFDDELDSLYLQIDHRLEWTGKGKQPNDDSIRVIMTTPDPLIAEKQIITTNYQKNWFVRDEVSEMFPEGYISLFQINRYTPIDLSNPTSKGGKARTSFESRRLVTFF
jgi:hypothetical protein